MPFLDLQEELETSLGYGSATSASIHFAKAVTLGDGFYVTVGPEYHKWYYNTFRKGNQHYIYGRRLYYLSNKDKILSWKREKYSNNIDGYRDKMLAWSRARDADPVKHAVKLQKDRERKRKQYVPKPRVKVPADEALEKKRARALKWWRKNKDNLNAKKREKRRLDAQRRQEAACNVGGREDSDRSSTGQQQ